MRGLPLLAVLCALVVAPTAGAWTWPTSGAVLQPFSFDPAHPYAAGQHRGIDVAGAAGSTVAAPAAGTVTFAGSVPGSGKSLTIATAEGDAVTLTHLGSLTVAQGAVVAEGDGVGAIGPSGDPEVAEPYVHLGVRIAADPQGYLDPLSVLPARPVVERRRFRRPRHRCPLPPLPPRLLLPRRRLRPCPLRRLQCQRRCRRATSRPPPPA
jgi:murein DD-endopeptidase MepM/ murein hydrolase activator NlpD